MINKKRSKQTKHCKISEIVFFWKTKSMGDQNIPIIEKIMPNFLQCLIKDF